MLNQYNISIGFVLYHPELSLFKRLLDIKDRGYKVYIFDNSPENGLSKRIRDNLSSAKYFTVGKNVGLGYGLSSICSQSYYDGNPALLFFDQDTVFDQQTLNHIQKCYNENILQWEQHSAIAFSTKKNHECDRIKGYQNTEFIINSGSLFLLEKLKKIGWHNENYFVDGVDYEFCLRSKINGFYVAINNSTPGFNHEIEQPDKNYRILKKNYYFRKYNASRVVDYITSSVKIIFNTVIHFELGMLFKVVRLLVVFILTQILVRWLSLTPKTANGKPK